jgi:hypothetical protein
MEFVETFWSGVKSLKLNPRRTIVILLLSPFPLSSVTRYEKTTAAKSLLMANRVPAAPLWISKIRSLDTQWSVALPLTAQTQSRNLLGMIV